MKNKSLIITILLVLVMTSCTTKEPEITVTPSSEESIVSEDAGKIEASSDVGGVVDMENSSNSGEIQTGATFSN